MKYSVAAIVAAAATGAVATGNATVITEVVDVYTTYCPAPTEITHGTQTYTVTEPTTLTITDCPCTITKPVIPTSTVICHDCEPSAPPPPPPQGNSTIPGVPQPTGGVPVPPTVPTDAPEPVPTAGAAKVAGLSGLVGLAGLAAFFL